MSDTFAADSLVADASTVALTFDKASYNSGDVITGTYTGVVLNPGTADQNATVPGSVSVNGGPAQAATGTLVLKGKPADTAAYVVPTATGLTFAATANPAVFTSKAP